MDGFKLTVASCEEMTIDGKKFYKIYAVLPNGGLVRVRGARGFIKPSTVINTEVRSQGDKYGFAPYLYITD